MLTNVLGVYLDRIKEREFDLPFLSLIHASGFYDIHYTHGIVEYGKDFIAKRKENGTTIQYSFQLKAGDVSQSLFRNEIMGQMLESVLIGLSHPCFNKNINHQAVLVLTGKMTSNAGISFQELNNTIENTYHKLPIIVWDRESLISNLRTHGLEGVHAATTTGFISYGNFYILYGKALEGNISTREIEKHTRQWLEFPIETNRKLLCAVIEAHILANLCQSKGLCK